MADSVLVIKLGALGDFVQALGPMRAIRDHHPGACVVLLTTAPYRELAEASGLVDEVWLDDRPRLANVDGWLDLRKRLRGAGFDRAYDLQTSDRSSFYFRLFWPGPHPEWSGIARGCSHPHANPKRDSMHTVERQHEQLRMAGIEEVPVSDLSWVEAELSAFALPKRFGLLVPGGAAHRPAKRWPVERYGELAAKLSESDAVPVVLGAEQERALAIDIAAKAPATIDLTGKTSLLQIAALAREAAFAVGNDTGPMHLTAAAGCASVVLFSDESDPALCAPRGKFVRFIHRDELAVLRVDEVRNAVAALNLQSA